MFASNWEPIILSLILSCCFTVLCVTWRVYEQLPNRCIWESLHPPFCGSVWRLCAMTQHLGNSQSIITRSKMSPVAQRVSFSRRSTTISSPHAAPRRLLPHNHIIRSASLLLITLTFCFSHRFIPHYDNYRTTSSLHWFSCYAARLHVSFLSLVDSLSLAGCTQWWIRLCLLINVPWIEFSICFLLLRPPTSLYLTLNRNMMWVETSFRIVVIQLTFCHVCFSGMLEYDPAKRFSIQNIRQHKWAFIMFLM